MIQPSTFEFLAGLKAHNDKSWFEANRAAYDAARKNVIAVVQQLIDAISEFDETVKESNLDPKSCLMRIHRDVRFSKDKSPYKPNFFAFVSRGGRKSPFGGYYLNIDPKGSFCGAGIYMPPTPVLNAVRTHISRHPKQWTAIVEDPAFVSAVGEIRASGALKTPPRGFDSDDPMVDYLKYKGYYTSRDLSIDELTSDVSRTLLLQIYHSLFPLVSFINDGIDAAGPLE